MIVAALLLLAVQDRSALDRWRESIDLDLYADVIAEALPRVRAGGDLATDGEALALAARSLSAAGEDARARELLDASHPSETSRGFVEVARARLAIERDDLEGARRTLLAAPGAESPVRFPAVPECWLLAGRALARGGEVARAAPLLERFLELAPLDAEAPSAWHMLVGAAIARGDEARAAELRARAQASAQWQAFYKTRRIQAREKPGEPLPRLGIAELFLAAGEFERARAAARTLTEQHPDFGRGWVALGRAEAGSGSLEAAQKACERAIACDGTLAPAHLELARILARRGDKGQAEDRYARYRALGGTEPLERR